MSSIGMATLPLKNVRITDRFWSDYVQLIRETVIPYQWEALNDRIPGAEPSHAIRNFRIAAGLEKGEFGGLVFQDSDLAKWLEAAAYSLATHPDPVLERIADEAIELIVKAQWEDGYLNTYYTIKEPGKRWTNLTECHELYCAGHMIEAGAAYYQATGKRKLLDAMCRLADHIDTVFGTQPGKLKGYDGHQEIELALVKLFLTTGNEKYLRLSQYFIDERGRAPSFFHQEWEGRGKTSHWMPGGRPTPPDLAYHQAHLPVREQDAAIGHAVRAVYMYTAMADLARLNGDAGLLDACRGLWNNIVRKQFYITGGIGSTPHGEAFTFDYDLPNDTVYAETCATIGLIFFAQRMLRLEAKSEYADVVETALYNLVLGSMSKDGKHYFYVNPLEVWPEASKKNPGRHHVKAERQPWFGCSCCPPNLARLIASLGEHLYTVDGHTIFAQLFIGSEAQLKVGGDNVILRQQSDLPWSGEVRFQIGLTSGQARFSLSLRVPAWCAEQPVLRVNGVECTYDGGTHPGYATINREWTDGDVVTWDLPMRATWMAANPLIRADAGKAAIQRGPLVYCFEEIDNGNSLASVAVSTASKLVERQEPGLLGGIVTIETEGWKDSADGWGERLYRPASPRSEPAKLKAIPYFAWGNRGVGEMAVWLRTTKD